MQLTCIARRESCSTFGTNVHVLAWEAEAGGFAIFPRELGHGMRPHLLCTSHDEARDGESCSSACSIVVRKCDM